MRFNKKSFKNFLIFLKEKNKNLNLKAKDLRSLAIEFALREGIALPK